MDRLFCALMLAAALLLGVRAAAGPAAEPVFFRMLYPQLTPDGAQEATQGEAVAL
ncbi:MAG: hypothetical protein ACI4PG_10630 [Candidatus Ventricola sp.]